MVFREYHHRGVRVPLPSLTCIDERSVTRFLGISFFRRFATGTLGPRTFGLSLSESCLAIFFMNMLFSIYPAYVTTWGPKLGLRQLCSSRFTYGYYGAIVPSLLSIIRGFGVCILSSILGGQAFASITDVGGTMGILMIAANSLFISICGLKFVNGYQNFAWIPVLLVFVVATGVSGKHFVDVPVTPAATLAQISNFGAILGGHLIPMAATGSDYTVYFHPRVSSWRIFLYSYLGLCVPTITLQCLGAAASASAHTVPHWEAGYADGNVGGLLDAMLSPVGKFGKIMMVILSLSVTATNAPTIYSMCMAFQTLIPPLVAYPRYVFAVFATLLITILSIAGQHKFYSNLSNFLGVIGYWAGAWVAAVVSEHVLIRKRKFVNYDIRSWDVPSQLPLGAAALGASFIGFGLAVPTMSQVWYTGPVARKFGDLAFGAAVGVTAILYLPLRRLEKRWRGD